MNVIEKIGNSLKNTVGSMGDINKTLEKNKDGINLYYVRVDNFNRLRGDSYTNSSSYYAYDNEGNYVGAVIISVVDSDTVEMEYFADPFSKNKGNITALAKDVIREIFEDKVFDLLKINDNKPTTIINKIKVAINEDNKASLRVAEKLGFNEEGILKKEDYKTNIKHL